MKYELEIVTDDSYSKSGRYGYVDAENSQEALDKGAALCKDDEWVSRITETVKRPGELGRRIVWDVSCGNVVSIITA